MPPRKKDYPNDSELAILQVLWKQGPRTVRQVHAQLSQKEPIGYTSVLKTLQIMFDKKQVTRDESMRSHVYRASISERSTQRRVLKDMLNRVFYGSSAQLAMQALSTKPAAPGELADIRKLIEELDQDAK